MRRPVLVIAALLLLVGCGKDIVIGQSTVDDPYTGPMFVEATPDHPDVVKRSGAAALALECNGEPDNGGDGTDAGPEALGPDAEGALSAWLEGSGFVVPREGYVLERDDGDRVLFSYDVDGATKVATIAVDGLQLDDETGWGVDSWAACDPSEWPGDVTDALDIGVWTDGDGERVPVDTIQSGQGAEHCDWQDITFLSLGSTPDETQFVRDTEGELVAGYDESSSVPAEASDSGFERDGRHLWTTADAAYLVSTDDESDVERWPVAREPIYCM